MIIPLFRKSNVLQIKIIKMRILFHGVSPYILVEVHRRTLEHTSYIFRMPEYAKQADSTTWRYIPFLLSYHCEIIKSNKNL